MDWSESWGEFDIDSWFGKHFAEENQTKSVIGNHSNDKCSSNGNVINLSRGVNNRSQVLEENDSENNVHHIIDNQCDNE